MICNNGNMKVFVHENYNLLWNFCCNLERFICSNLRQNNALAHLSTLHQPVIFFLRIFVHFWRIFAKRKNANFWLVPETLLKYQNISLHFSFATEPGTSLAFPAPAVKTSPPKEGGGDKEEKKSVGKEEGGGGGGEEEEEG